MATPINAPMAGEIWHLSIEDLFQPVTEVQRLGGDGPFVINLSVSTAPINNPTKSFEGCRDAQIYQIQVTEDGRTRYRLRLGPFANEDQADAVLAEVRETYPGALTATAGASDLRVIANMQPKVEPKQSEVRSAAQPPDLKAAVANFIESAAPRTQAATKQSTEVEDEISIDIAWPTPELVVPPAIESAPAAVQPAELAPEWALPELDIPLPKAVVEGPFAKAAPVLTEAVAPLPKATPKVAPKITAKITAKALESMAAPKAAAPVIAPIPIAVDAPVLTEAVVPKPKSAPAMLAGGARMIAPGAAASGPKPAAKANIFAKAIASALKHPAPKPRPDYKAPTSAFASLRQVVVATAPAPPARQVKKLDQPLESLEHTQTIRALTAKELEDIESSRWFVIQLALADRAFDPYAVPNLDIFSEYRLYSVAGLDQGRVVHALRLGFFREEIGAVAVASYLAAYWDKPTIKRVSVAERERFANQKVEARKDVEATGTHAAIEITDELVAPRKRKPSHAASIKGPNQRVGH
jgi:hypothetical protein